MKFYVDREDGNGPQLITESDLRALLDASEEYNANLFLPVDRIDWGEMPQYAVRASTRIANTDATCLADLTLIRKFDNKYYLYSRPCQGQPATRVKMRQFGEKTYEAMRDYIWKKYRIDISQPLSDSFPWEDCPPRG